jgi:mono/diheme cytochrome c family protein
LPFGTLYSTNITPDKETGIGNYSDAQFLNAVQRGISRDGSRLYPAMPYPSYSYMTDADALAIKAYLFSLAPVHAVNRADTGPMGEAVDHSFSLMVPADINAVVAYLHSIPPLASSEPATIAPPAPPSPKRGGETADILGRRVFEGACVSCHDWSGISTLSPYATIAGARAVNDPSATNVAQIVISGTKRHTPAGIISMPAFGAAYSDTEIAAVVNYVTKRFGAEGSKISAKEVADLRGRRNRTASLLALLSGAQLARTPPSALKANG